MSYLVIIKVGDGKNTTPANGCVSQIVETFEEAQAIVAYFKLQTNVTVTVEAQE